VRSVEAHDITRSNRLRSKLLASTGALGVDLDPDAVNASRKAVAHSQGRAPFTLFEARSINFAIVVYAINCTSMLDLH
jgi:hypothetical protein